eukprot:969286-Amphidinium_carterae.1
MVVRPNRISNPEVSINAMEYDDALVDALRRVDGLDDGAQCIFFVNTIDQGHDLVQVLTEKGISTGHLHHKMQKPVRGRIMRDFKEGRYTSLVGT